MSHDPKFGRFAASRIYSRCLPAIALLILTGAAGVATAATLCVNKEKKSGCYSTISAAVAAASAGDVIQVVGGTYKEQVVITKSLSLLAFDGTQPVIDATGLANGIFVNGMSAAPKTGVADVIISGFAVRNANFEGILVANAADVSIVGNNVSDNDLSVDLSAGTCPGLNTSFETNEQDDCGEGIHLMATRHSTVVRNESDHNSGGLLITDETGVSEDNLITGNDIHDNPFDCGITLASHGPATAIISTATVSYGVRHNTIANNTSAHNGYQVPGAGAGVGIFAPFPGTTAAGNVVIGNNLLNNGLPGVAMHNHASAPAPAPPINMNGNVVVGNHFSGNGADTEDTATSGPTGVNVYSTAPVYGTIVSQNVFDDESIDVAFNAPSGQLDVHFNDFSTGTGIDNIGAAPVNATENWWHCAAGPGGKHCATVVGTDVSTTPWLTFPFGLGIPADSTPF
ncbi:MAG: right-handed parallel beta-helix repeat-containing protein [Terracidiphilus sp.]